MHRSSPSSCVYLSSHSTLLVSSGFAARGQTHRSEVSFSLCIAQLQRSWRHLMGLSCSALGATLHPENEGVSAQRFDIRLIWEKIGCSFLDSPCQDPLLPLTSSICCGAWGHLQLATGCWHCHGTASQGLLPAWLLLTAGSGLRPGASVGGLGAAVEVSGWTWSPPATGWG